MSPDLLTVGGQAEITYSNPALAGQIIVVDIDDGGIPLPETDFIEIELDANGFGSATWQVPDWAAAVFNAPDAPAQSRMILPKVLLAAATSIPTAGLSAPAAPRAAAGPPRSRAAASR